MKQIKLALLLTLVFVLFFSLYVSAAFNAKPDFRFRETYRLDLKTEEGNLLVNRLDVTFIYAGAGGKRVFNLTPYIESRWNHDHDVWVRNELGMEIGKDITPWLYLGEGIHYADLDEDGRAREDFRHRNTTEWETRLKLHLPLIKNKDTGATKLKGYILNEFTYDIGEGEALRNEVAFGLVIPLGKNAEAGINWRHIDRIHYYDSDNVEVSFSLLF